MSDILKTLFFRVFADTLWTFYYYIADIIKMVHFRHSDYDQQNWSKGEGRGGERGVSRVEWGGYN